MPDRAAGRRHGHEPTLTGLGPGQEGRDGGLGQAPGAFQVDGQQGGPQLVRGVPRLHAASDAAGDGEGGVEAAEPLDGEAPRRRRGRPGRARRRPPPRLGPGRRRRPPWRRGRPWSPAGRPGRRRRRSGRPAPGASPTAARRLAVAAPMPRAPPVMMATPASIGSLLGPRRPGSRPVLQGVPQLGGPGREQSLAGRRPTPRSDRRVRRWPRPRPRPCRRSSGSSCGEGRPQSRLDPARPHRLRADRQENRRLGVAGVGVSVVTGRRRPHPDPAAFGREPIDGSAHRPGVAAVGGDHHDAGEGIRRADQLEQRQLHHVLPDGQGARESRRVPRSTRRRGAEPPARPVWPRPGGRARATAISVSVARGRCGPCCSVDPTGRASTVAAARAGHVRPGQGRRGRSPSGADGPAPARCADAPGPSGRARPTAPPRAGPARAWFRRTP